MKKDSLHGFALLAGIVSFAVLASIFLLAPGLWAKEDAPEEIKAIPSQEIPLEKHVAVYLDTMKLELKDGTTTLMSFPVVSKGRPGSYYETPGGTYISDYKTPLHFSSFGHVWLPYSVHVFGNFFIHGIPYYENGERVSSSYSGGCIRIADEQMKIIYDFVEGGTPIIIGYEHQPEVTGEFVPKDKMARFMAAIISLEFLNQDDPVQFNGKETTRLALLPKLLSGNESVALFYAKALGNEKYIALMNEKAKAIGLHETSFATLNETPKTSGKDLMLFYSYLKNHKSYLLNRESEIAGF